MSNPEKHRELFLQKYTPKLTEKAGTLHFRTPAETLAALDRLKEIERLEEERRLPPATWTKIWN